jgi:DNA processing protein
MSPLEMALLVHHGGFHLQELEPELPLEKFLKNADPKRTRKFQEKCGKEEIERQEALIRKHDVKLVSFWDDDYPQHLREIRYPPAVLFVRGNTELLKEKCVGVVGTRRPTSYGVNVTKRFVKLLSEYFVIVSGMAFGIDSVAHKEALSSGGKTVAVLGTGVDVVYPQSNEGLFHEIVKNGCVVSEYPMGTCARKHHFPARNRIIAGLSDAIIVTEAPIKSGALITVKFALESGRDVFAVPGDIDRKTSKGTNYLIKSGAYPLTDEEDLETHFGIRKSVSQSLDDDKKKICDLLRISPRTVDELVEELGWSVSEVLRVISEMELMGMIWFDGGAYRLLG